jgi:hypothetical protein
MTFKNDFRYTDRFAGYWILCSILATTLFITTASYADDAADIARLIELSEEQKATKAAFRKKTISFEEANKRLHAIDQEKRKINNSHGKSGSKERRAWNKQFKQAKREHDQKASQTVQTASTQRTSAPQPQNT